MRIQALSPGWRSSFEALLESQKTQGSSGNAGLALAAAAHPAAPGFQRLAVTAIDQESADVISLTMARADGQPLPAALPGQYVVLRLQPSAGGAPLFRSYSLSRAVSMERYRISVKIEPNGVAGNYLREHVREGDTLDLSSPRGSFISEARRRAGCAAQRGNRIDARPGDAARSSRGPLDTASLLDHAVRDGQHRPFAAEVRRVMGALTNGRSFVCFSGPTSRDKMGEHFDATGHLSRSVSIRSGSHEMRMSTFVGRLASWRT